MRKLGRTIAPRQLLLLHTYICRKMGMVKEVSRQTSADMYGEGHHREDLSKTYEMIFMKIRSLSISKIRAGFSSLYASHT